MPMATRPPSRNAMRKARSSCIGHSTCSMTEVLMITSIEGKNLAEADAIGRQDPYIVYELPGNAVNYKRKTKTDTDGGTEPRWDEITKLPVVDHHELTMKVFDEVWCVSSRGKPYSLS